ncbi:MAG: hypothetical protein ABIO70_12375 [Pseudomonadota bacterium]
MSAGARREVVLAGLIELAGDELSHCERARLAAREEQGAEALCAAAELLREAGDRAIERLELRPADLRPGLLPATRLRLEAVVREEVLGAAVALAGRLDRQLRLAVCAEIERFLELAVTVDRVGAELSLVGADDPQLTKSLVAGWHRHQRLRDLRAAAAEGDEDRLQAVFELGVLGACVADPDLMRVGAQAPWPRLAEASDLGQAAKTWLRECLAALLAAHRDRILAVVADAVDLRFGGLAVLTAEHLASLGRAPAGTSPPARVPVPENPS